MDVNAYLDNCTEENNCTIEKKVKVGQSLYGVNVPYKTYETIAGIQYVIDADWLIKLDNYMAGNSLCVNIGSADLFYIQEYIEYSSLPSGEGWEAKVEELLTGITNGIPGGTVVNDGTTIQKVGNGPFNSFEVAADELGQRCSTEIIEQYK